MSKSKTEFEITPMYLAKNVSRYSRQELICEIEDTTKRTLLCYVAGETAAITPEDIRGFGDLLYNVSFGEKIDLLIHTIGGDIDSAEKIIKMLQSKTEIQDGEKDRDNVPLRVIVPDLAKSAGTLIALGANQIVMSDSSELGTIDPQVRLPDRYGNYTWFSAFDYIDAYKECEQRLNDNPSNVTERTMFNKFEPHLYHRIKTIKDRAKKCAEKAIKQHGGPYTQIVSDLMNTKKFPSHSQVIDWEDAEEIGLPIEYITFDNPVWREYWKLYCSLRTAITAEQKIFESRYVSYIP